MENRPIIDLLDTENKFARDIADMAYRRNRDVGIKSNSKHLTSELQIQNDGHAYGAQMAFCKLMNVYMDLTTMPRKGGEDCILEDKLGIKYKVDVKQNNSLSPMYLIVGMNKTLTDAGIYVLMGGTLPTFKCVGWELAENIMKKENIHEALPHNNEPLSQPCYLIHTGKLRPIESLFFLLGKK